MNTDILEMYINLAASDTRNMGNREALFPIDDAADFAKGLRFVPGEVTVARRKGRRVFLVQACRNPCCWYWQFPDGSRTYYWEREAYEQLARKNNIELVASEHGTKTGDPGPCQECGNPHTQGGHITSPQPYRQTWWE